MCCLQYAEASGKLIGERLQTILCGHSTEAHALHFSTCWMNEKKINEEYAIFKEKKSWKKMPWVLAEPSLISKWQFNSILLTWSNVCARRHRKHQLTQFTTLTHIQLFVNNDLIFNYANDVKRNTSVTKLFSKSKRVRRFPLSLRCRRCNMFVSFRAIQFRRFDWFIYLNIPLKAHVLRSFTLDR